MHGLIVPTPHPSNLPSRLAERGQHPRRRASPDCGAVQRTGYLGAALWNCTG